MDVTSSFELNATLVANDFIDRYMVEANGEYVKIYLYILRHQSENLTTRRIADALNNTEIDVRRAVLYWEKLGALKRSAAGETDETASGQNRQTGTTDAAASGHASRAEQTERRPNREKLQGDDDFSQLLYIAQRYLNKIFTQRDMEVFAHLYDDLGMSAELLEYLVEYCVQNGHTSIRYIETVGLSWHERGLRTVEEAKAGAEGFTKHSFAVMRAFGLTDRKPGEVEIGMIRKWFDEWGFTRELVVEACNRTMEAIHTPSFSYADKILEGWKKAGVRNLRDVSAMDEKRRSRERKGTKAVKPKQNQFHNFDQRNTDYDSLVLDQVRDWISR
ncbi:MAG: DnaD domain protein [Clostridiales bacterium]|nr:DnaD domain protein [Clostridiales bacterium]